MLLMNILLVCFSQAAAPHGTESIDVSAPQMIKFGDKNASEAGLVSHFNSQTKVPDADHDAEIESESKHLARARRKLTATK